MRRYEQDSPLRIATHGFLARALQRVSGLAGQMVLFIDADRELKLVFYGIMRRGDGDVVVAAGAVLDCAILAASNASVQHCGVG